MKKIILLLALFYSISIGQVWNNTVTTSINEPYLEKMDLFTNAAGNHILIKRTNGSIVYYRINSQGQLLTSSNPTPFSASGDFPNITGSNDQIFALYKEGNFIKGKYSTTGGNSWINLPNNISTTANLCNGIDAVWNYQGVHLVYATRDSYPDYETHYSRLNTNSSTFQWVDYKNVTDYDSEVGGKPTVAVTTDRIIVSYNNNDQSKTRDKFQNIWLDPQLVSDGEVQAGSVGERVQVKQNYVSCVFFDIWVDLGMYGFYVQEKNRILTGNSWPTFYNTVYWLGYPQVGIGMETTSNDKLNVVIYGLDYNTTSGLLHRNYDGTNWSDVTIISDDEINYELNNFGFSKSSNDLFVIWKPSNSNMLKYRQYDAAPLAPQNLQLSANPGDNKVRVSWSKNNEPDIAVYEVWRKVAELGGGWVNLGTT